MHSSWIWKASVIPAFARAEVMGSTTPKSVKVVKSLLSSTSILPSPQGPIGLPSFHDPRTRGRSRSVERRGRVGGPEVVRPSLSDPEYRQGVIELLGLLGAGEYLAFERLVSEAALAPTLSQRVRIADIAEGELGHFHLLRDRLVEMGADPDEAMSAFLGPLERYHRMTAPSDWLEGLVKAYVGDSISEDFYREVGAVLDEETAALVLEVCSELGKTAVVIEEVRAAIAADPRVAGRLALWGRRLLGEMLSQAQSVAAEHDGLAALILSEQVSSQIDLFGLVEAARPPPTSQRMTALGLAA